MQSNNVGNTYISKSAIVICRRSDLQGETKWQQSQKNKGKSHLQSGKQLKMLTRKKR
jgi:hypothetical protein